MSSDLSASKLHNQISKKSFPNVFDWLTAKKTESWYDVECFFDSDLLPSDKVELDDILATHDATPDVSDEYLIYGKIETDSLKTNKKVAPKDINYDILGLHKSTDIWDDGYLKTKSYWKDYNETTKTYSNLVVKEDITYTRDGDNLFKRDKSIKWYKKNWDESTPKNTKKYYSIGEWLISDKRARSNIIEKAKEKALMWIVITEWITQEQARPFGESIVHTFTIEMSEYKEWNKQPLIDGITNYDTVNNTTNGWLDNITQVPDWQGGFLSIRWLMLYHIDR